MAWWVWVAGGAPSAVVTATSATTTGQATAALDALLLAGSNSVVWTAAAVLVAVAVCSGLAVRFAGPPSRESAGPAPDPLPQQG